MAGKGKPAWAWTSWVYKLLGVKTVGGVLTVGCTTPPPPLGGGVSAACRVTCLATCSRQEGKTGLCKKRSSKRVRVYAVLPLA